MFKALKNSLGLNTLKLETTLINPTVEVGSLLRGVVNIYGTDSPKTINHVTLSLCTIAEKDGDNGDTRHTHTLGQVRLSGHTVLPAHETLTLPFELSLSPETPITELPCHYNETRLWIHTDVDVASTLDSSDKDYIRTTPTPVMSRFIEAMSRVGFVMQKADVELGYLNTPYGRSSFGCYQELEYGGRGFGLNSVEVSFLPVGNVTHVVLEIDRAFRSDSYKTLSLHEGMSVSEMASIIRQAVGV